MSKDAKPAIRPSQPLSDDFVAKLLSGEVVLRPIVSLDTETAIDAVESGAIDSFDM